MTGVRLGSLMLGGVAVAAVLVACGSSANKTAGPPGNAGGSGATDAGDASVGGSAGSGIQIDAGAGGSAGGCSTNGASCGDGGVCAGGQCCDATAACNDKCCGAGQVCSFQQCVTPGATCYDSSDCAPSEYCELALGNRSSPDAGTTEAGADGGACVGGAQIKTGRCLPRPPTCAAGQTPGNPPTCLESCEYHPPSTTFSPVLKYSWGGQTTSPYADDIMMTPVVIELDDDNCDGKVNEEDIPEIVFSTFSGGQYTSAGTLHAISVVGGQVVDKWSVPGVINPTKQIAAGNIDGQPGNEVVGCGVDGKVHAWNGDGSPLWTSAAMTCFMPSIADLNQDGHPEVIVEGGILDGATGALEHAFSAPLAGSFVVSDIDGDGKLDIVTASQGFDANGQLFVDTGIANTSSFAGTSDWKSSWPAVADFDKDGVPEVVAVDNINHALSVWRYDASQPNKFTEVRAPVDINGTLSPSLCPGGTWGNTHGGGPPTIADFNGDGIPDVALAGGVGYVVFDGKKLLDPSVAGPNTILWQAQTTDCSSASTGSTVFDFNGDGVAEVVYSDEQELRIYDGPTGNVLWSTCNTTATLIENPVVADVDNDGHADIVAVSNAYAESCNGTKQAGIRIFGDTSGNWVRTRRVWNEHAYHVTNVGEDGSIPQKELPNYTQPGLDNFRQNKQPGSEFAAPDAVVSVAPQCSGAYGLTAVVQNIGEAALPAGVVVGFYENTSPTATLLGKANTTRTLYPAESEAVFLPLPNAPAGVKNGSIQVYAVVDDTQTPHPDWTECRTDNNQSALVSAACAQIH
jgi:FG-GAP-like repeat